MQNTFQFPCEAVLNSVQSEGNLDEMHLGYICKRLSPRLDVGLEMVSEAQLVYQKVEWLSQGAGEALARQTHRSSCLSFSKRDKRKHGSKVFCGFFPLSYVGLQGIFVWMRFQT